MDDRWQERGREDRSGRSEDDDYGAGRGVATQGRSRQGSEASRWEGSGGSGSGDWQGYIVPYRYYGPGYRGVGYYSVLYQGPGEDGDAGDQDGGRMTGEGRREMQSQGQGQGQGQGRQRRQQPGQMGSGPTDYWQSGYGRSGYGDAESGRSGQRGFAGRGPKGYQRSDERLRDEVSDRLMEHDEIDAGDIEVQVQDGEVTLTGTVPDRWMKRLAEDIAEQVMGVREVMNQVRIQNERESSGGQGGRSSSGSSTGSSGSSTGSSGRSTRKSSQTAGEPRGSTNGKRETASTGSR